MAGFVHDIQKKQHRERAQPQKRKRLGFLEKKKDYRLRAQDYHKKQAQLKILKQKAKNYNEDEYYHAMTTKKTDSRGILISEKDTEILSNDEILLLKTQDTGYLNTMAQREAKKIAKELNDSSTFKSAGQHTVFVESRQEMDDFDAVKYFDTDPSLLYKRENRLRVRQLNGRVDETVGGTVGGTVDGIVDDSPIVGESGDAEGYSKEERDLNKIKKLNSLQQRIQRQKKLRHLNSRLEFQKELMKGGNRKKIETKEGVTTFKWKNQRKR
ncbi:hypothetical protein FOA43_001990 [Brettanomyces nanus]|uniref:U3 small nucleolar RNA-associated protein 11 n=1 Tax=Eeniella nana TaxID=13502 RepID=A0A875S122_EENNA|nr:uncharacterized protein FOA43_001990 [Brettanomyces nanus]QPG74658.1 hypothetical protein FOA43_001990 [Brettanomyces nanus]